MVTTSSLTEQIASLLSALEQSLKEATVTLEGEASELESLEMMAGESLLLLVHPVIKYIDKIIAIGTEGRRIRGVILMRNDYQMVILTRTIPRGYVTVMNLWGNGTEDDLQPGSTPYGLLFSRPETRIAVIAGLLDALKEVSAKIEERQAALRARMVRVQAVLDTLQEPTA